MPDPRRAARRLRARLARPGGDGGDARPRRRLPRTAAREAQALGALPALLDRIEPDRRAAAARSRPRSRRPCSTASRASAGARGEPPPALAAPDACRASARSPPPAPRRSCSRWCCSARTRTTRTRTRAPGSRRSPPGRRAAATAWAEDVPAGTRVRLRARGLPAGGGAMYELWCVRADGHWVSGGTFRAGRDGRAEAVLTAAVRPGDYHVMVVTRHTSEGEHGAGAAARPAALLSRTARAARCVHPAMRKPMLVLAAILAGLGLIAAGCGGDDDDNDGGSDRLEQLVRRRGQRRRDTASGSSGGGGGATKLKLTADPGGALKFDKTTLTAKAGKVTITMDNPSDVPHAVEVEGNGVEEETKTRHERHRRRDGRPQGRQVRVLLPGRRPQGGRHGGHADCRLTPTGNTSPHGRLHAAEPADRRRGHGAASSRWARASRPTSRASR